MALSLGLVRSDGVKAYGKTDGSTRRVPLTRRATLALEQQRQHHEHESRRRGQLSPLAFTSWQGGGTRSGAGHLNLNNWRRRDWYPALDAAGLTKRGPYALRHTFDDGAGRRHRHLRTRPLQGHQRRHDRPDIRPSRGRSRRRRPPEVGRLRGHGSGVDGRLGVE